MSRATKTSQKDIQTGQEAVICPFLYMALSFKLRRHLLEHFCHYYVHTVLKLHGNILVSNNTRGSRIQELKQC